MASSIVISAAQQLGNLLVAEATSLYEVSDQIESLKKELEWMGCFLRDADNQQHQQEVISKCVSDVTDLAYEAEDIVEKYLHGVSHHRPEGTRNTLKWFSCILCTGDASTLHNLGSEINSLRVKISELTSRLKRYGIKIIEPTQSSIYNTMVKEQRRTYSHVEEDDVVGLENHVKKLVGQLVNKDFKVVSISGVGGLGKSTLAKKVFLDKATRRHFNDICVWVYISKQVERDCVFREILRGLYRNEGEKSKIKDMEIGELPGKICELLQQRKCFVVLDDIWTVDAWKSLEPAFLSIKNTGSKIMVTTRTQGLLQHIDSTGYRHCLEPLSEEDSWKLLQLKAFPRKKSTAVESSSRRQNEIGQDELQVDDDLKLKEKMGKEMLKHCDGLPLAIIALGGILLSKRTVFEWKHVQENISTYLMTSIGESGKNGGVLRVLELSYHDLPFYLKPCFLYLGHFPEDYEIRTRRLYHLWEAEGILAIPSNNDADVEGVPSCEIGERYLYELIDRSMVQVGRCYSTGRIKTCRLHDVMRDMCLRKCKDVCFLNVFTDNHDGSISNKEVQGSMLTKKKRPSMLTKKMRRCAFHVSSLDSLYSLISAQHGGEAPYLRSLLLFKERTTEFPFNGRLFENILKAFPMLRVLDLQKAFDREDLGPVGHLIHLRYLSVRHVVDFTLSSSFWDLKNLICLEMRHWSLSTPKLPNMFHKMRSLRHLYLPSWYEIEEGEKLSLSAQIHQMETLKNFDPSKCQMEDLQKMKCLRIFSMAGLYDFNSKDVFREFADSPAIKSGQLTNPLQIQMEAALMNEDPTILTSLRGYPSFTKFNLNGCHTEQCDNIDNAIARGDEVFPSSLMSVGLTDIRLSNEIISNLGKLPHLVDLSLQDASVYGYGMSFPARSFKRLRKLWVGHIVGLDEWEVGDGALSNLRFLTIANCYDLKKIPDGLPDSVHIECIDPCINGIEKYNTCQNFKAKTQETDEQPST